MDDQTDTKLLQLQLRSDFAAWAVSHGNLFTLTLLGECKIVVEPQIPALAGISNKTRQILLHPLFFNLYKTRKECAYFILVHELRHLIQISDFALAKELINMDKLDQMIRERLKKVFKGSTPENIAPMSEKQIVTLRQQIFNVAADASLHEDLIKAFPPDTVPAINRFISKVFNPVTQGTPPGQDGEEHLITVPFLEEMFRKVLLRDMDWVYYAAEYVNHLQKSVDEQEDGEFIAMAQEWTLIETLSDQAGDYHDFDSEYDPAMEALKDSAGRAAKKLERKGKRSVSDLHDIDGSHCGFDAAAELLKVDARKRLNQRIKRAVDLIKRKVNKIIKKQSEEPQRYSYSRVNKILAGLPGRRSVPAVRRLICTKRVLVLDTSGSMFIPEFLEQMVVLARYLTNSGRIHKTYCCDVDVYHFEFDEKKPHIANIRGGGGTIFGKEQVDWILNDLEKKEGVEIYYATDGQVWGLDEVTHDERVVLSTVLIPNLLKESEDKMPESDEEDW